MFIFIFEATLVASINFPHEILFARQHVNFYCKNSIGTRLQSLSSAATEANASQRNGGLVEGSY